MVRAKSTIIPAAWALILAMPALAALVDPRTVGKDDVGPPTTYGETAAEAAAKKIVFEWNYTSMIERAPRKAFEAHVSPRYCDHGHSSTAGERECASYDQILVKWVERYGHPLKPGDLIEIPTLASVDGEMVTTYGAGVDIYRVHQGKITEHWDASPPALIKLKAHGPMFLKWLLSARTGPPPYEGPSISALTVDAHMLNTVDVGPGSPDGETAQEAANKRLVFEFNHLSMIEGKPREAFEKYISKRYCGHGHLSTRMQQECGSYEEQLSHALQFEKPRKAGDAVEIPTMASVDGEMVTMYGAGVDIFRVHAGKITDHWDASPPADVTLAGGKRAEIPAAAVDVLRDYFGNTLVCAAAITGNDLCHLWLGRDGTFINIDPTGGHAGHFTVGPMRSNGKVPVCLYWDTSNLVMPPEIQPKLPPVVPSAHADAVPDGAATLCKTADFKTTCTRMRTETLSEEDRRIAARNMGERFHNGMCYPLAHKHVGDIWFEEEDPLPGQAGKDKLLLLSGRR